MAWQTSLPRERATRGLRMSVAVAGDIAAIGWPGEESSGGSAGYRISTGKQLWSAPESGCRSDEHAGGTVLVTLSMCGDRYRAGTRNAQTGKINWLYTAPRGTADAWIPSTAPLIVALSDSPENIEASHLVSVSPKGEEQATWTTGRKYHAGCSNTRPDCGSVIAHGSTLYLATRVTAVDGPDSTVRAFDVRTGRATWSYTPPRTDLARTVLPIQARGNALIAYLPPAGLDGAEVHQLSGGKSTLLMRREDDFIGDPPEDDMIGEDVGEPVHFADGRLFLHTRGEYAAAAP